jgi:hypothetical protein
MPASGRSPPRGAETISAVLTFDTQGDLAGFVSEDRYLSADGKTYARHPWTYGEFVLESLTTDPAPERGAPR